MIASTYPLLDFFWTMIEIFFFIIWIWLAIMVFVDIFRSHDMGGWAKAAVGALRGDPPAARHPRVPDRPRARECTYERRTRRHAEQKAFDQYVRQTVGTPAGGGADELAKLADLKDRGVITDEEFATMKAKMVS